MKYLFISDIQTAHRNTHSTEISEGSWERFLSGTYRAYEVSTGQLAIPDIRRIEGESDIRQAIRPSFHRFFQYVNLPVIQAIVKTSCCKTKAAMKVFHQYSRKEVRMHSFLSKNVLLMFVSQMVTTEAEIS